MSVQENTRKFTERLSWSKKFFLKLCNDLDDGELTLHDGCNVHSLGKPSKDHLKVSIYINNDKTYQMLMFGGSNGAAEAYMQGYWETDNLTGLIRLLLRNRSQLDAMEGGSAVVAGFVSKIWHAFNRNTKTGSNKNIAAHYDLGNDFFGLFLDKSLMYSSAIYQTGHETLEQASQAKLERICAKLDLVEDDHLIEIGSGWGGMAIYAASHYGCRVTTTTISDEQYQATLERVAQAGLAHRITVLKQDYRDLKGQFDKLVSIEMVEAVGHQFLDGYFQKVSHLLRPEGIAVIQAITIDDGLYESALRSVDFIKRYIFPGSFIPCVSGLTQSASKSNLRLFNLEDIGPSYALTLRHWRARFNAQLEAVRQQGFDERFIRMWEFYLCYCEGGFLERSISDVQLAFVKPGNRRAQWVPGTQA
jgi:cyclopropane-fatty-acyl-phospholipid synthase